MGNHAIILPSYAFIVHLFNLTVVFTFFFVRLCNPWTKKYWTMHSNELIIIKKNFCWIFVTSSKPKEVLYGYHLRFKRARICQKKGVFFTIVLRHVLSWIDEILAKRKLFQISCFCPKNFTDRLKVRIFNMSMDCWCSRCRFYLESDEIF